MKIDTCKVFEPKTFFKDVEPGQTFYVGSFYMRLSNYNAAKFNAVRLDDGVLSWFSEQQMIRAIYRDAVLVLDPEEREPK